MKLDICIPAYNEAPIIVESLQRITDALEVHYTGQWRVLVCDNASTDGTGEVVRGMKDPRYIVVRVEEKGKGAALVVGARASDSELFGFIDADLSADPSDISSLARTVENGQADIAIGSRLLDERLVQRGVLRTASSRVFNQLRRHTLGIRVEDSQCGLKVMNARGRDILRSCEERSWFIDLEFLARAEHARLSIQEIPIHWNEFRFPGRVSKLRVFQDGLQAFSALLRIRRRIRTA